MICNWNLHLDVYFGYFLSTSPERILQLTRERRKENLFLPVVSLFFFLNQQTWHGFCSLLTSIFGSLTTLVSCSTPQCDRILCTLAGREALRYEAAARWSQAGLMRLNAATREAFSTQMFQEDGAPVPRRIGQKKLRLHHSSPRWDKRAAYRRKFKCKGVRVCCFIFFIFIFFCF